MIHQSKSFKASAVLLALSLAAGGTLSAQPVPYEAQAVTSESGDSSAAAASATPFADVKAGHWAEKHISKLAFQSIIVGNNGLFRPADSVTRQEAIVMAVRFAGLEGQLNRDEAVVFPTSFKVDKYFVPYVILAFEKGLIDQNEEFALADQEPQSAWGSSKASREWVTKLIVNAIGKGEEARSQNDEPISFADAASVGNGYAGYINEAVSLNLVNGVAGNRFDPQGAVNRAMMATLLSRAESQYPVSYEGQTEGIVASLGDGSIVLYTPSGVQTYAVGSDTVYARFDSEQLSAASNMVQYAKASVIASNGKAQYIELLSTEPQVETISGTFDRLIASTHKMWIWVNDEPVEIRYDDSLQVVDEEGNALELSALTPDASVIVTRDKFRQSPLAISVQIVNAPVNKTGSGTVQAIGASSLTIADNGINETWNVSPDAIITSGSTIAGSLNELKAGDQVTYEVKNSAIIRINVTAAAARTESGVFYSTDNKTITYMKDKKYVTKPVTDTTVVTIEGLPAAELTDLQANDQLEVTVNASDQVTGVKVTNRKVEWAAGVEIRNYDAKYKTLYVVDGSGKPRSLYFNANSQIEFNGVALTLESAAASGLFSAGRKITVSYTGDTIVKVQLSYRYTGTVVSVDAAKSKLTLSIGGNLLTLPMQSTPAVDLYEKPSGTLADVKTGDDVTATMNQEQDKVIAISVHRSVQLKVVSVNTSTNRVTLRDNMANNSIEYSTVGWELTDEAGSKITLGNLSAGNVVNVMFVGKSPSTLQRVAVNLGAVRAVDSTQVTIAGYDGRTITVPLGAAYTVVRGGVVSASYAAIQAGDRVEVRKDAGGNVLVTVVDSEQKKFWKYDAATGTLQTKRASINDTNYKFSLAGVALTSGGTAITPQSLVDGDVLTFYYYEGKLIEIEKK